MTTKARVLFVDDEERIVNLLKIMFRSSCEVFTATNGHDALKIIGEQHIHVIVSDQRMPEMLGVELLETVRDRSPATMRILLTGYSDLSAIVGSVNKGEVFRFINKPWDQVEIKSIITEVTTIALAAEANAAAAASRNAAAGLDGEAKTVPRDILVIDDNEEDLTSTISMLTLESFDRIHSASSIAAALKVLAQHDVAVIVTEAYVGGHSTVPFLNLLKQEHPMITAVMLTGLMDAELMFKLINQAQIHRFASKPVKRGVFSLAVTAAMKLHESLRADPSLMKRYKVEHSEEAATVSFAENLRTSLASLRSRFKLFS